MDEQEFVSLLQTLLLPDTQKVKAATSKLNKTYYTSPASFVALIHIITSHSQSELRQLASVEARKHAKKHWPQAPEGQKAQLRERLLKSTIDDQEALPRHAKARLIAAIASVDLQDGEWPELPGILHQAATSSDVRHREVGLYMIYTLMEEMPDMFQENMAQMLTLLSNTLQDPESTEVKINSMLALAELAMVLDTDEDEASLKAFHGTIPSMVKVLQESIENEDEVHSMQAFDVFNKLLSYEPAFLNPHFADLLRFFMHVARKSEIDDEIRSQALSFLMQSVRYRKLKVQSLKIGEDMTTMCLQVLVEMDDLPDDDDDLSPPRSALALLDILSESLPPSQVVVPLFAAVGPYVQDQDPKRRRAGILALGTCVQGAPDFVGTQLSEILPLVLRLLEDPSASVRSAALNSVSQLADDLAEDMGKEHARLLPAIVKNFDLAVRGMQSDQAGTKEHDMNIHVVKLSCIAVDFLIEGLEEEDAARYVEELVPRFAALFEHENHKVQLAAVSAMGSIASASKEAFRPYFEKTMRSLGPYISAKDGNDDLEVRSMAVDSLGKIAFAVGPELFQPFVEPLMRASEEGLHLGHQRLKETSFILWSILARVYEENFQPFLSGVAKALIQSLEQEETDNEVILGEEASDLVGKEVTIAGKKIRVAGANGVNEDANGQDVVEALMEGNDDDDDWNDLELGTASAVAMEKEIAVEVLGDVLTHAKGTFLPYMEKTIELTIPMLDHGYEGIRKSAVSTLWRAYACLWGLAEDRGMENWQPGLPVKVQPTAELSKLGKLVMTGTLALWEEEADRSTVTEIHRNIAATLKLCGPAILTPSAETQSTPLEQITAVVLLVLQKQHPCQQDVDLDEDEALGIDEESAEYDWLIVETVLEVVSSLASALGEQFGQLWKIFESPVLRYASSQERSERSSSVGTVGECIQRMGAGVSPYTKRLLAVLSKRMGDEDPETKSNACFAMGVLCEKSEDAKEISSNYNSILVKLEPLLDSSITIEGKDDPHARLLDNAAGCVSRMIAKAPQNVPLEDVLPRLVDILPLKGDYDENEAVFAMVVALYQQQNKVIQALTPRLMPVFETVLGPSDEQLSEEMKGKVQQLVQYLKG